MDVLATLRISRHNIKSKMTNIGIGNGEPHKSKVPQPSIQYSSSDAFEAANFSQVKGVGEVEGG